MIPRIFILLFILLNCFTGSAQAPEVVLFTGPQATSVNYKVDGIKQPAQFKFGAIAGVAMKVPFDNQLYFFPSVYYSLKGYKVTFNNPSFPPTEFAKNNNTTIHTIEISPMFHIDFSKKPSHLFVRFGPAVDFAFSGKETFDTVSSIGSVSTVSRPMVFSFGDYGRITASGNLHLGYESEKGWMISGFYSHGIGSMNNADEGPKILHRILGLSFGWKLRPLSSKSKV